jgi:ABC-type transporter Mla MlaB component
MEGDSELTVSVVTDENGRLILLAGEVNLVTIGRLTETVADQLAAGARDMRIDMSELRSVNSEAIWVLLVVARPLTLSAYGETTRWLSTVATPGAAAAAARAAAASCSECTWP